MKISAQTVAELAWGKMDGLLPCTVQHARSGKVLMLGYMNQNALEYTLDTGQVTFFSRSRQQLWTKGEISGNSLTLVSVSADCDRDALLALALPKGPTCHTGADTCWFEGETPSMAFISELEDIVAQRKEAEPSSSYTAQLYASGIKRIAQKVGEEGVETALAAVARDQDELKNEAADLLYHLLVLLQASDLSMEEVISVLRVRHSQ